ncbi:galactose mutarotase-like protein [Ascobolus immersus RN42]|uniref:Galactose mutarotase-like protein n=1 Tax=Ascobolus immersus RN42 TaxID=1160509 RepID=A0A3N4I270_ASCIM|nr:galactose mutarotase-like protein [Ascobolus immersus RN42]
MPALSKEVTTVPYGAIIQELKVDDKNIVLGFKNEGEYLENPAYFGATIGRVANRVQDAKFNLNSKTYKLEGNDRGNALHGGSKGWHTKVFTGGSVDTDDDGKKTQVYSVESFDGEEGYPAKVNATVRYTSYVQDGKHTLEIEYEAEVDDSDGLNLETIVNLTNHSYFNIGPGPKIDGTEVTLATSKYLVVDSTGIPTEQIADFSIQNPPFTLEANKPFTLGQVDPDIDDCFVFENEKDCPLDTRSSPLKLNAAFYHPESKIHLEVHSTEPAFQFYTGRFIDVKARKDGSPARDARSGFCVEPSRWVNAVNVKGWEKQVVVKKGEKYGSKIVYKTWKD